MAPDRYVHVDDTVVRQPTCVVSEVCSEIAA